MFSTSTPPYSCMETGENMEPNEKTRLKKEGYFRAGCSPSTKLEKRLIIVLCVTIAVAVGLCLISAAYYRTKTYAKETIQIEKLNVKENQTVCLRKECINTASNLLKSIDFTQKPCEDFYSFVCGNWIKNTHVIGQMLVSQFSRLNTEITLRVKELLEIEDVKMSVHERKVKDFYDTCVNRDTKDEDAVKEFLDDLKEFGGWPMIENEWDSSAFNWSDIIGKLYEKGYPHDLLFTIGVDMDIKNTSRSLIYVNRGSLHLNDRSYYLLTKDTVINNYKFLIFNLAIYFQPKIDLHKLAKDIESALVVEKYLAKKMPANEHERNPEDYYNIMTLEEIEALAPMVPWKTLLKRLLPPDDIINKSTGIMVVSPDNLLAVNWLLETVNNEAGKEMLANYLMYRTVLFAAEHLGKDVFSTVEDRMHHTCHRDLWQVCVGGVMDFFHMSLTATYAKSYMDSETKDLLEMMFRDIQTALLSDIKKADWLDAETKKKALTKVLSARSAIAYRDEILDEEKLNEYYKPVELGLSHFSNMKAAYLFYTKERMKGLSEEHVRFKWTETTNVLTANAFYQPSQNSIIVPIGLLQDAFFAKGRPNYVNYGSLGTILGHEYTHAFDSTGRLYDEVGNYRMWWSNQSWSNFLEREKCFVDQYNQLYEPTVKTNVNGSITLGENIADNGGLLAAYHAYTKLLGRIKSEETLPGLPFNEKQMFWISFASAWCRKQSNHTLKYLLENSAHAPSQFRVNGALSNIPQFSEDFNCTIKSALNPSTKCHLWE